MARRSISGASFSKGVPQCPPILLHLPLGGYQLLLPKQRVQQSHTNAPVHSSSAWMNQIQQTGDLITPAAVDKVQSLSMKTGCAIGMVRESAIAVNMKSRFVTGNPPRSEGNTTPVDDNGKSKRSEDVVFRCMINGYSSEATISCWKQHRLCRLWDTSCADLNRP
jgi:hypothetical protein